MKLIIGALALTLSLTACGGGSKGSGKGNTKEIDGTYASATENKAGGYILAFVEINDGQTTSTNIDLSRDEYIIYKSSVNVNGGKITNGSSYTLSCDLESGSPVVDVDVDVSFKVSKEGLALTDEDGVENLVRINSKQAKKIKAIIKTLKPTKSCNDMPESSDENMSFEETKEVVNQILSSKKFESVGKEDSKDNTDESEDNTEEVGE